MKHSYFTTAMIAVALTLSACGKSEAPVETKTETPTVTEATVEMATPEVTVPATNTEVSGLVNPNDASELQLLALTAVAGENASLVSALIEARPFENAQAMDAFLTNYMGDEAREVIYAKMFIPMNLNTTPEADFKIIPGVGKKMAHEFEEYRPYKDMAQFDKEISKYVDAKELARLRQYVTLN